MGIFNFFSFISNRLLARPTETWLLAIFLFHSLCSLAAREDRFVDYKSIPPDGVQWEWDSVADTIVIGDLHGDVEALWSIVRSQNLVDADGNWIKRSCHLVLLGDLYSPKKRFPDLINLINKWESQSEVLNSKIHWILGNHDLYYAAHEASLPRELKKIAVSNLIVKINKVLFVHGGLDSWIFDNPPARINATARAWIKYWQDKEAKPGRATECWKIA